MSGDFPEVEIIRVDVVENPDEARAQGIRRVPAFASQGETLSGFLLGKRRIRRFLNSLTDA